MSYVLKATVYTYTTKPNNTKEVSILSEICYVIIVFVKENWNIEWCKRRN